MEATKITEATSLLSVRCENCGYGIRHKDQNGLRKWCKRCIDVYCRKEKLKPEHAEQAILKLVELLYIDANIEALDKEIRDKLLELKYGQDVFMHGLVGVGKTYAMAALIRQYIYEGYDCQRINFDDFCVKVRSTFAPAAKETAWEMIEPLKRIDKLFIDDLGLRSTQESQFTYDIFFSVLNKRQERMLPTFINSNKTIDQLGQNFDERIASRLRTALSIELTGRDRRIAEKESGDGAKQEKT
ncbi:hypothetical protein ES703_99161 [subsurface metagenome]